MAKATRPTKLVGRAAEVGILEAALASVSAGSGRVVLLEGEAGIGKTRLVQEAMSHARTSGFQVFEGGCDDLGRSRAFAPLLRALGIDESSPDPDRAEIARLVAHDEVDTSSPVGLSTPGLQFRVVEALGTVVEYLASARPVLLVLEDLHWADASTLVAARSIARRIPELPVLLLATYRSGHSVADLHRVADDALRSGGTLVPLGPLDPSSVRSLVAEALGAEPAPTLLERLEGATGNPLFITEYVHALAGEGELEGEDGAALPTEFRRTVLRRLGHLPDETNDMLRVASVLGSTFSSSDLCVVLRRSPVEVARLVHHAVVAGVVTERDERLAFRHDLVRDAIYEQISSGVRKELHREVGRALADAGVQPLLAANHLALGAEPRDADAAEWLRRAARDVASRSPAIAVELLERARDLLGRASPERGPLLAELAMALAWSGRLAEAEALSREVLALSPGPDVAGPLRCGLVYALIWQGRPAEALRHAETGPDENLGERDAALLLAEASVACMFAFDLRGAATKAKQAAEAAQAVGHDLALCQALIVQAWTALFGGDPAEAVSLTRRAIAITDESANGDARLAHPHFFAGMPLMYLDRPDEAESVLQGGRQIAEEMGLVWSLPLYHAHLGTRRFIAGDWDGAVAEFEASLAIADEVGMGVPVAATASWLAVIQLHRNDLEGAERTIAAAMRRIAETGPQLGMGILNWARALLHETRGELEEGIALLKTMWDLFMAGGPVTDPWSCMALVQLCVRAGQTELAASFLPVLDEQAAVTGAAYMRGQALRCRGLVERDAEILKRAVAEYRESPRPLELAAACEDTGLHLAQVGSIDEATRFLDEALGIYDDLGATRDAGRVRAELRRRGATRGAGPRRARATSGWESLTKTELEVVALVAQRLSNPEVAERLFISRHTVASHLKHIYQKLGVSSRIELAGQAARHQSSAD